MKTTTKALRLARTQAPLLALGVLVAAIVFAALVAPGAMGLVDGSGVFCLEGYRTDASGTYPPQNKCGINGLKGNEVMCVVGVVSFLAMRRMFATGAQNGASRAAMTLAFIVAILAVTALCALLVVGTTTALRLYGLEHGDVMVVAIGSGYHISMTAERLLSPHMAVPEACYVIFGLVSAQAAGAVAALVSFGDSAHRRALVTGAVAAALSLAALSLLGFKLDLPLYYFYFSACALALVFIAVLLIHTKSFRF